MKFRITHRNEIKKIMERIFYSTDYLPIHYRNQSFNFFLHLGVFGNDVDKELVMEMSKVVDAICLIEKMTRHRELKGLSIFAKRKNLEFWIVYFPEIEFPFQLYMHSTTVNDSLEQPYSGEDRVGIYKGKLLLDIFEKLLGILLVLNPDEFRLYLNDIQHIADIHSSTLKKKYLGVAKRFEDERRDFEIEHLINFYCEGLDWERVNLSKVNQINILRDYTTSIENCMTKRIDKEIIEYIRG